MAASRVTSEAIADYHGGMPVKEVLQKHQISKTQFYRQLKKQEAELRGNIPLFTGEQQTQMVSDYDQGSTIDDLVEKYGGCSVTISGWLKDAGCHIRTPSETARVYTDAEIDQTIANYINGLTATKSGESCGASEPTVFRWLKDRGIDRRHQPDYGGDKRFFKELNTEQKLYWFGFLCADGNLSAKKYVRILLSSKDRQHLELFKSHLGYRKPIAIYKKVREWADRPAKEYEYARLLIGCARMVRDLERHGMRGIKHGDASFLYRLEDEQFRHFLRGYFDGDGSIYYSKKNKQWVWMVCGPDRGILEYMLSRCLVVKRWNAIKQPNQNGRFIWRVAYSGNLIVPKICEWLYKDATVYLGRKKILADACRT